MAEPTAATPKPEAEPVDTRKGRRVKLSPEIEAILEIEGMLDELDDHTRFRVLTWMCLKYGKNCHMSLAQPEKSA